MFLAAPDFSDFSNSPFLLKKMFKLLWEKKKFFKWNANKNVETMMELENLCFTTMTVITDSGKNYQ